MRGTALLAFLLVTGCGHGGPPPSAPSALSGKPLPAIHRPALDGASVDTTAARGRVVVVKFFADYCAPCKKTLPAAEALHRDRPDVVVIGISEDENAGIAEDVARRYQLSFPVVFDAGQVLAGRFRVNELPATFVAGKDGSVRWVGGVSQAEDALARAVEAQGR